MKTGIVCTVAVLVVALTAIFWFAPRAGAQVKEEPTGSTWEVVETGHGTLRVNNSTGECSILQKQWGRFYWSAPVLGRAEWEKERTGYLVYDIVSRVFSNSELVLDASGKSVGIRIGNGFSYPRSRMLPGDVLIRINGVALHKKQHMYTALANEADMTEFEAIRDAVPLRIEFDTSDSK